MAPGCKAMLNTQKRALVIAVCFQLVIWKVSCQVPRCIEDGNVNGTYHCAESGISLPNFPSQTTLINFNSNNLTILADSAFHDLQHVRNITLRGNMIAHIASNQFSVGLFRLVELDLSENRLTSIPTGVLTNLPRLQVLRLNQNQIATVGNRPFRHLSSSLTLLTLYRNRITEMVYNEFRQFDLLNLQYSQEDDTNILLCNVYNQTPPLMTVSSCKFGYLFSLNDQLMQCIYPPTEPPTEGPTLIPSLPPTIKPTLSPSYEPTSTPSSFPSKMPSASPSVNPTSTPSTFPTELPTIRPSQPPIQSPSTLPSAHPTSTPTVAPSSYQSITPTIAPRVYVSIPPTDSPTSNPPTRSPQTRLPSTNPSLSPFSTHPSSQPTQWGDSITYWLTGSNSNPESSVLSELEASMIRQTVLFSNGLFTYDQIHSATSITDVEFGVIIAVQFDRYSGVSVRTVEEVAANCNNRAQPVSLSTSQGNFAVIRAAQGFHVYQPPSYAPSRIPTLGPSFHPTGLPSTYPTTSPASCADRFDQDPFFRDALSNGICNRVLIEGACGVGGGNYAGRCNVTCSGCRMTTSTLSPTIAPSSCSHLAATAPDELSGAVCSATPNFRELCTTDQSFAALCTFTCSGCPTYSPTFQPSIFYSITPSLAPSSTPSTEPTAFPTEAPSTSPTGVPTLSPVSFSVTECGIRHTNCASNLSDTGEMVRCVQLNITAGRCWCDGAFRCSGTMNRYDCPDAEDFCVALGPTSSPTFSGHWTFSLIPATTLETTTTTTTTATVTTATATNAAILSSQWSTHSTRTASSTVSSTSTSTSTSSSSTISPNTPSFSTNARRITPESTLHTTTSSNFLEFSDAKTTQDTDDGVLFEVLLTLSVMLLVCLLIWLLVHNTRASSVDVSGFSFSSNADTQHADTPHAEPNSRQKPRAIENPLYISIDPDSTIGPLSQHSTPKITPQPLVPSQSTPQTPMPVGRPQFYNDGVDTTYFVKSASYPR